MHNRGMKLHVAAFENKIGMFNGKSKELLPPVLDIRKDSFFRLIE